MRATRQLPNETLEKAESPSEPTRVQRVQARTVPVESMEYHLFAPRRAHDPLLDRAYDVWRDVWHSTFTEVYGTARVFSDEFARQDEIGVLTVGPHCISVTGLRCLDMSLARSREDSYFQHWPVDEVNALGTALIGISSNTAVHPDWRGSLIEPPANRPGEPERLSFVTIALTIQRFFASPADYAVALTRNDRSINRVAAALGATSRSRIILHGADTDVVRWPRNPVASKDAIVGDLWRRRHQG